MEIKCRFLHATYFCRVWFVSSAIGQTARNGSFNLSVVSGRSDRHSMCIKTRKQVSMQNEIRILIAKHGK
jgi:hypothetical protein